MSDAEAAAAKAREAVAAEAAAATKAKSKPASQEPRAALAAAISELEAARADCVRLQGAVAPAREAIAAAEAAHGLAEEGLERSRAGATESGISALLDGQQQGSSVSLRAAREAVEDAGDRLALAHSAAKAIREQIDSARERIGNLERRVRASAIAVLGAGADAAIARAEEHRRQYAAALLIVRWLRNVGALSDAQRRAAEVFAGPVSAWPELSGGAPELERALAELQRNANAAVSV